MNHGNAVRPQPQMPPPAPRPLTSFPLKLMRCNFTYMMGNRGFRMTAVAEALLQLTASRQVVFLQSRTLFNLTVPACNLIKPTSSYLITLFTAALFFLTFFTKLLCSLRKELLGFFFFFFDNVKLRNSKMSGRYRPGRAAAWEGGLCWTRSTSPHV